MSSEWLVVLPPRSRKAAPDAGRAFCELRGALSALAADPRSGGAAAARRVLTAMRQLDGSESAHEMMSLFVAVGRARTSARRGRPSARYDWRAWNEISRLAGDCLIFALQAMRRGMDARRASDSRPTADVALVDADAR